MTGSIMATGCDVTESNVTGIDVIRPNVGDCPWGVILIVWGVVWYSKGVFYHVRVLNVVSLLHNLRVAYRGLYVAAASADRWICSSSNIHRVMKENPIIFWKPIIRVFWGSRRIRSRSFHGMGTSVYQCDCRTYRQWKIDVCPMVRSQYQTHDDSQARSDLNV